MQAIINVDGAKGPNPAYNKRKPASLANNPERDVPKGTIIDHPDCWRLCLADHHIPNEDGEREFLAEPYDDECKEIVGPLREQEATAKAAADKAEEEAKAMSATAPKAKAVAARKPRSTDE